MLRLQVILDQQNLIQQDSKLLVAELVLFLASKV